MVIYRPHRGGLAEAMEEAREYQSMEEMLAQIVAEHTDDERGPAFALEDLVLGSETKDDPRIGWHDTRYVCTRRYFSERYDPSAPVGFCAEDYDRPLEQ